jgi:glutamate racemase
VAQRARDRVLDRIAGRGMFSDEEIAREISGTLARQGMLAQAGREGGYEFACSGDPAAFRTIGSRFLQMPFGDVQQVDPGIADGA